MADGEPEKHETFVVDTDGQVTAVGRAVARRLRDRAGRYRLVAGPENLLLFERLGSRPAGPRILLSGEIGGPLGAVEVLNLLASAQLRGELIVITGEVRRSIFLESGVVRMAASTDPAERLGEILSRLGLVAEEEIQKAALEVGPEHRLGQVLVERGLCTQTDLYGYLQRQVEEIVYATTLVQGGAFLFTDGFESERWPAQVHLPAQGLLMEGVRRMDEMAYFRKRIPSDQVTPLPVPFADVDAAAKLEEPERAILALCDGGRTLAEIAKVSALGEFDSTRSVFHLLQRGLVKLAGGAGDDDGHVADLIDGFNDILAEILRTAAATGRADETREFLGTFLSGWGSYRELYEGAGPDEHGRFDRARILRNLRAAKVSSSRDYLYQAFNEYLCFALFAAGSVLRRDEEQDLSRRIEDLLGKVRGQAQ